MRPQKSNLDLMVGTMIWLLMLTFCIGLLAVIAGLVVEVLHIL